MTTETRGEIIDEFPEVTNFHLLLWLFIYSTFTQKIVIECLLYLVSVVEWEITKPEPARGTITKRHTLEVLYNRNELYVLLLENRGLKSRQQRVSPLQRAARHFFIPAMSSHVLLSASSPLKIHLYKYFGMSTICQAIIVEKWKIKSELACKFLEASSLAMVCFDSLLLLFFVWEGTGIKSRV